MRDSTFVQFSTLSPEDIVRKDRILTSMVTANQNYLHVTAHVTATGTGVSVSPGSRAALELLDAECISDLIEDCSALAASQLACYQTGLLIRDVGIPPKYDVTLQFSYDTNTMVTSIHEYVVTKTHRGIYIS